MREGNAGQSGVFRAGTLSRLKRRIPMVACPPFVGRCPTPCQGCVFEKAPLGTLKNFFRCVKAKPSPLWVFCAFVHGGRHPPKAFGFSADASHLHDLKRPSLFRRDKVPARNTHKIVRLRLYAPKKVFEGSKGRFSKTRSWQGEGGVPQREKSKTPTEK